MSFMQRQVIEADYYAIETNQGTFVIPADAVMGKSPTEPATVALLAPYCEDCEREHLEDLDTVVEPLHGFLARLSAPGFMDCTEWCAFKSEQEANDYLDEYYGDTNS